VQPADIDGHSLQHESSALPDGLISLLGELVEELLIAVNRTGRMRSPKLLLEENELTQRSILSLQ
jgi:hypothetical protein